MKAYTDIEQSKKLAEILPFDTADMWWPYYYDVVSDTGEYTKEPLLHKPVCDPDKALPCWSFAALLEIIRNNGRYELQMYEGGYYFEANGFMTESYFNAIDACIEIIVQLHKDNQL